MGEKEREQLKERLLKMVVNEPRLESMPPMTMAEVMVNSMSKPNLEPLLDFISQEIEKAREEGRRETLLEMEREFSEYEVPDDVRYTHPLFYINNIIEEKLSKLTTK